jgi:hypothetical protein
LAVLNNEIDHTCEKLIHLAVSAMEISTTSADRSELKALETAVGGLDPDKRAAIVEHLDSPGRFQRINEWAQWVQGVSATVRRPNGRFSRATTRVLAIEIVWRFAANKGLPSPGWFQIRFERKNSFSSIRSAKRDAWAGWKCETT